jgi:photosystem II stability/assembly factor-like uncharacterized protein
VYWVKYTLSILLVAAAAVPSRGGSLEYLGLSGRRVESLFPRDQFVYAGTDSGVYRLQLNGPNQWELLGLRRCQVRALIVFNEDTLLAGIAESDTALYRSTNAGHTWAPFENGYGGAYQESVLSLDRLTDSSDVLFATGAAVIARSPNRGQSWNPVWGGWGGMAMGMVFVQADPNDASHVWAGGESALFGPWLYKSTDFGLTFDEVDVLNAGDNRCHDIAIMPGNTSRAWVSMEGYVRETQDGGESWKTVFENNFYLYCIEIDPMRPENLYLSGFRYDKPLTLFVSRDTGSSWDNVVSGAGAAGIGALCMKLESRTTTNTLYLGTTSGVYRYLDSTVSCCTAAGMGNIDGSPDGLVTMGDLTVLIDHLFITLTPLACPLAANVDLSADGLITMGDLTVLVDHLFITLTPLPACP